MTLNEVFNAINNDVQDIVRMGFEVTQTQGDYVPSYEDPGLTFENGQNKRAKIIESCVLHADIRNSTMLSKTLSKEVMARLYTAFVKSILFVADHHGGIIRNIIGDRVMIVFPKNNCFTNAVDTAISINTVASKVINVHFKGFEFKVGIGIDYGEMKVIKVGIPKQAKERTSYKNLVWIGNPANIASKLTDVANKEIVKTVYRVTRNPDNPKAYRQKMTTTFIPLAIPGQWERVISEPAHLPTTEVVDLTPEEFASTIRQLSNGTIYTVSGKMLSFEKKEIKSNSAAILMSQKVWEEYSRANPSRKDVVEKFWKYQDVKIKEYTGKIVGSDTIWAI